MKQKKQKFSDWERREHISWCMRNDIKIYIKPINQIMGVIVINEKGREIIDPVEYRLDNKVPRRRLKKGETRPIPYSNRIQELYTNKYVEHYEKKEEHFTGS